MGHYPLIVKRQIKGSSIWEQRNGTVTLSPFSLFCAECIRRKTRKREMFIFGLLPRAALRLPGAFPPRRFVAVRGWKWTLGDPADLAALRVGAP